ncbi:hypothetical protein LTR59_017311, partial [Friedmanniomyces endolithicus]
RMRLSTSSHSSICFGLRPDYSPQTARKVVNTGRSTRSLASIATTASTVPASSSSATSSSACITECKMRSKSSLRSGSRASSMSISSTSCTCGTRQRWKGEGRLWA